LYFESTGRYALVIAHDGFPKFASNGRVNATPEENKAVVEGSIAHFGTYSVTGNSISSMWITARSPIGTAYSSVRSRSEEMTCRSLLLRRHSVVEARRWPGDG
jgi:hypothetical protein